MNMFFKFYDWEKIKLIIIFLIHLIILSFVIFAICSTIYGCVKKIQKEDRFGNFGYDYA